MRRRTPSKSHQGKFGNEEAYQAAKESISCKWKIDLGIPRR